MTKQLKSTDDALLIAGAILELAEAVREAARSIMPELDVGEPSKDYYLDGTPRQD